MSAVADRNMEQLEAVLRGLSKKSAEEQIFRGVSSGWVAGFLVIKAGVIAGSMIGGVMIVYRCVKYIYISVIRHVYTIDWDHSAKLVLEYGKHLGITEKAERFLETQKNRADHFRELSAMENSELHKLQAFAHSFTVGVVLGFLSGCIF